MPAQNPVLDGDYEESPGRNRIAAYLWDDPRRRPPISTLKPLQIDIVSDVVCPWCYIGKRRIENALALVPDVPVEVHWRPFFLNSWVPREGISREEYLTTKFGSPEAYKGIAGRVVTAAGEEGILGTMSTDLTLGLTRSAPAASGLPTGLP